MTDTLDGIRAQLRQFVNEREWEQFHDPKNLAMAVASEAGELLAEYRWIGNSESDVWSADPENRQRVAMEIADVAITLLMLSDRLGIDLCEAMSAKLARNAARYPVEESRGRHSRSPAENKP